MPMPTARVAEPEKGDVDNKRRLACHVRNASHRSVSHPAFNPFIAAWPSSRSGADGSRFDSAFQKSQVASEGRFSGGDADEIVVGATAGASASNTLRMTASNWSLG